jgi:uncharacterized protein
MAIMVSIFELHLPEARSLKQKRKVIKSLIERIHRRFRVSIAETGHHDLHQRCEISIAAVARSPTDGRRLMDAVRELVDGEPGAMLLDWDPQLLEEVR